MNNKGFTLIELLATIALLAVISVISFVSINSILIDSKIKDCESLVSNITTAAKEYVSDNRYGTVSKSFDANVLMDGKYLDGPIINPFDNNEEISGNNIIINIELNADYTAKNIEIRNVSGDIIDCDNTSTFEFNSEVGSGVAGDSSTDDDTNESEINGESGSLKSIVVDDRTSGSCAQTIEYFYSDSQYRYYFTCQKSNYVYVIVNGEEYLLKDALNNKIITMSELENAGYTFPKETLNVQTS